MRHPFSRRPAGASWAAGLMLLTAGLILQAPLVLHADTLLKMTAPRLYPQVTLLGDGTVLVAGGWGGSAPLRSAERFDPKTGLFTALPPMSVARDDSQRALRLPDGRVLITSGTDSRRADLFDPATNTFSQPSNMTSGRGRARRRCCRTAASCWPADGTPIAAGRRRRSSTRPRTSSRRPTA